MKKSSRPKLREFLSVFKYGRQAVSLVWQTHKQLSLILTLLTLIAGLLPAAIAFMGKKIIDSVIRASNSGTEHDVHSVLIYIAIEGGIIIILMGSQRGIRMCQSLFQSLLSHKVNTLILEKALLLEVKDFEDPATYDTLTQIRRDASRRPFNLVMKTFGLLQDAISLVSYSSLLLSFSPLIVLILFVSSIPVFISESFFSHEAFTIFKWRSPDTRKQLYLEMVMAREDYVKEVKLYKIGNTLLNEFKEIFWRLYKEDHRLTIRRGVWGYILNLFSTLTLYGAYAWIATQAIIKKITLGDMTMYLLIFKNSQSAFASILSAISGMYEDNLYINNLYEFLDRPTRNTNGLIPKKGTGIKFTHVSFTYPGAITPTIKNFSLSIPLGKKIAIVGTNGSGKTTLIKLLLGLYTPQKGTITLDGEDVSKWDQDKLFDRFAVIFQDFNRYQLKAGENIGVGDIANYHNETQWKTAGTHGMADPFIQDLPLKYHSQLGTWFNKGQELSLGQWQKVALSRLFMRQQADILVLDEPTAAMDAEAEANFYEHVKNSSENKMVLLISHRFSTVRMADHIIVLEGGELLEEGSHQELIANDQVYAKLFQLQAKGYQ